MNFNVALIHVLPPGERRCLDRKEAASYCGISTGTFDKMVRDGRLPPPLRFSSRKIWDRAAIDRTLDNLSGTHATSAPADLLDKWRNAHGQG